LSPDPPDPPDRADRPDRPERLVVVVGTGTEVGKTWVAAHLLTDLRAAGLTVAARKPAQSFDPGDDPGGFDSAILGAASGESSGEVCPPHRCYELAMAPPMAADALGRPRFTIAELMGELSWPPAVDVGLVETAGGVRSPQAEDGDAVDIVRTLDPDVVVLVADAGLGTINAVRLTVAALSTSSRPAPVAHSANGTPGGSTIVVLNRYDESNDVHVWNRRWLADRDGLRVLALPGEGPMLVALVRGS
jgi:dethiobiotin synthetase